MENDLLPHASRPYGKDGTVRIARKRPQPEKHFFSRPRLRRNDKTVRPVMENGTSTEKRPCRIITR